MKIQDLLNKKNLDYFYIMHLSYEGRERRRLWNHAKKDNIIGLQHIKINEDWEEATSDTKNSLSNLWRSQFNYFCDMERGDIVVVMNGYDSILGVAKLTIDHHNFTPELWDVFFDHNRPVEWIKEYEYDNRKPLKNPITFRNTLALIDETSKRWNSLLKEEI